MKKNTLLAAALFFAAGVTAQNRLTWANGTTGDGIWSPLAVSWEQIMAGYPIPTSWQNGFIAVFDGGGAALDNGDEKVEVSGDVLTAGVEVNSSRNYFISQYFEEVDGDGNGKNTVPDSIKGTGALIKDGSGILGLDVPVSLSEGTIARGGLINKTKDSGIDVWGNKIVLEGGTIGFCSLVGQGNNNSYIAMTTPIEIPEGQTGAIQFPRRANFQSKITGSGTLILRSGGDRVHMGKEKEAGNDFSEFTGKIIIEGFDLDYPHDYGTEELDNKGQLDAITLNSQKSFDAEDIHSVDSTFATASSVHIAAGGTLNCWAASQPKCYLIPELTAEDETSRLTAYVKDSDGPRHFYMIGRSGSDVVFPGIINIVGTKGYNHIGIIKEGKGTYTFTGRRNNITGGIEVREGRVLVICPDDVRKKSATGWGAKNGPIAIVRDGGIFGGIGRFSGVAMVYGTLQPGADDTGTMIFADTLAADGEKGKIKASLNLQSTGRVEMEIRSADDYDKIIADDARFAVEEGQKPKIIVKPAKGFDIKDGDSYVIFSSESEKREGEEYEVEFVDTPEGVTFTFQEEFVGEGFRIVVKASGSAQDTAVEGVTISDKLSIFPNPSNGEFKIEGADVELVEIYNNQGQLLKSIPANFVDLSDMPRGVYFARVATTEGVATKKIILK